MAAGVKRVRVDLLLVERGLAPSRERARAYILAGRVLVKEQKIDKPGVTVPEDAPVRILGEDPQFVSRGGLKLAGALERWKIAVQGRACLDVGASTGGFTDCLLQNGAARVTAVDTGFGQIAMKLRSDTRVRLMERTNARLLEPGSLVVKTAKAMGSGPQLSQGTTGEPTQWVGRVPNMPKSESGALQAAEKLIRAVGRGFIPGIKPIKSTWASAPEVCFSGFPGEIRSFSAACLAPEGTSELTLLVMDVSFISATLLLEPVFAAAPELTEAVILVKPQFEAGRGHVGKGGIVKDPEAHQLAIDKVADCVRSLGWEVVETIPSPITGMEGNREFLLYARRPPLIS